jgi:tetratricopeptide (TPR) repeat protein
MKDVRRALRDLLLAAIVCASAALHAQIDPRAALLERGAWDALAAGRAGDAAAAFRDALAADPKNARLHLGSAIAASQERRDDDARRACERALELDPALHRARALLGQLQYRAHDLAAAIRTYEALTTALPDERDRRDARATLDRWRREADLHDRMQQTLDSHFTVSFEGPAEAAVAEQALASLDRAYWRIGQLLGVYPSEPIAVVLYTAEQFRDITRSPRWAAGAYDGVIRVPMRGALDDPSELDRVLAHEFTHALIRGLAPRGAPTWLDEGLATALETGDLAWAEKRTSAAEQVPLRMLQSGFSRFSGDQAALAYATSALAARRLLEDAGGVAVANLLRDLGEGASFESAFLRRIQRPFAEFDGGAVR